MATDTMREELKGMLFEAMDRFLQVGQSIIEVGSGDCSLMSLIVEKYSVSGIASDPFMVKREKRNLKCIKMYAEDIESLNTHFDMVFSIKSFHHIGKPTKFIKGAYNSLNNGGVLLIVDWRCNTDTGIPERYYCINEIEDMLLQHSFEIVHKRDGKYGLAIAGKKLVQS